MEKQTTLRFLTNKAIRRRFKFKKKQKKVLRFRVNEDIRIPRVFVVDETGKKLGEMTNYEAFDLAKSKGLDLVEVSPNAKIPVCKITDYGKFQYIKTKQTRIASAKQKKVELKGVRLGLKTGDHDLGFKKKQAEKFLSKGNKVKIEIILKGREKAHYGLAQNNLKEFADKISIPHRIEEDLKKSPRGFSVIITPE